MCANIRNLTQIFEPLLADPVDANYARDACPNTIVRQTPMASVRQPVSLQGFCPCTQPYLFTRQVPVMPSFMLDPKLPFAHVRPAARGEEYAHIYACIDSTHRHNHVHAISTYHQGRWWIFWCHSRVWFSVRVRVSSQCSRGGRVGSVFGGVDLCAVMGLSLCM